MSQHCQGEVKCDEQNLCACLPAGIKVIGCHAWTKIGWKVALRSNCQLFVAHCKSGPEALKKARKMNRKEGGKEYIAVRITTKTRNEVVDNEA